MKAPCRYCSNCNEVPFYEDDAVSVEIDQAGMPIMSVGIEVWIGRMYEKVPFELPVAYCSMCGRKLGEDGEGEEG